MPFLYDGLARVCYDKRNLINWLQENELLGDFGGTYYKCFEGNVFKMWQVLQ